MLQPSSKGYFEVHNGKKWINTILFAYNIVEDLVVG
jgi:hypothetical protein